MYAAYVMTFMRIVSIGMYIIMLADVLGEYCYFNKQQEICMNLRGVRLFLVAILVAFLTGCGDYTVTGTAGDGGPLGDYEVRLIDATNTQVARVDTDDDGSYVINKDDLDSKSIRELDGPLLIECDSDVVVYSYVKDLPLIPSRLSSRKTIDKLKDALGESLKGDDVVLVANLNRLTSLVVYVGTNAVDPRSADLNALDDSLAAARKGLQHVLAPLFVELELADYDVISGSYSPDYTGIDALVQNLVINVEFVRDAEDNLLDTNGGATDNPAVAVLAVKVALIDGTVLIDSTAAAIRNLGMEVPVELGEFELGLAVDHELSADDLQAALANIFRTPTAAVTAPQDGAIVYVDQPVNFVGQGSGGNGAHSYSWDFGDGSDLVNQPQATHLYTSSGIYVANLTVSDCDGDQSRAAVTLYVEQDLVPVVSIQSPVDGVTVYRNDAVSFSATATSGNGDLNCSWNFGDGSVSSLKDVAHTYTSSGIFTAAFSAVDRDGDRAEAQVSINVVENTAPQVSISVPLNGIEVNEGDKVSFAASVSGGNGALSYSWSFGDGAVADQPAADHVYAVSGSYTATLTVSDIDGDTASDTVQISVKRPVNVAEPFFEEIENLFAGQSNPDLQVVADRIAADFVYNGKPWSSELPWLSRNCQFELEFYRAMEPARTVAEGVIVNELLRYDDLTQSYEAGEWFKVSVDGQSFMAAFVKDGAQWRFAGNRAITDQAGQIGSVSAMVTDLGGHYFRSGLDFSIGHTQWDTPYYNENICYVYHPAFDGYEFSQNGMIYWLFNDSLFPPVFEADALILTSEWGRFRLMNRGGSGMIRWEGENEIYYADEGLKLDQIAVGDEFNYLTESGYNWITVVDVVPSSELTAADFAAISRSDETGSNFVALTPQDLLQINVIDCEDDPYSRYMKVRWENPIDRSSQRISLKSYDQNGWQKFSDDNEYISGNSEYIFWNLDNIWGGIDSIRFELQCSDAFNSNQRYVNVIEASQADQPVSLNLVNGPWQRSAPVNEWERARQMSLSFRVSGNTISEIHYESLPSYNISGDYDETIAISAGGAFEFPVAGLGVIAGRFTADDACEGSLRTDAGIILSWKSEPFDPAAVVDEDITGGEWQGLNGATYVKFEVVDGQLVAVRYSLDGSAEVVLGDVEVDEDGNFVAADGQVTIRGRFIDGSVCSGTIESDGETVAWQSAPATMLSEINSILNSVNLAYEGGYPQSDMDRELLRGMVNDAYLNSMMDKTGVVSDEGEWFRSDLDPIYLNFYPASGVPVADIKWSLKSLHRSMGPVYRNDIYLGNELENDHGLYPAGVWAIVAFELGEQQGEFLTSFVKPSKIMDKWELYGNRSPIGAFGSPFGKLNRTEDLDTGCVSYESGLAYMLGTGVSGFADFMAYNPAFKSTFLMGPMLSEGWLNFTMQDGSYTTSPWMPNDTEFYDYEGLDVELLRENREIVYSGMINDRLHTWTELLADQKTPVSVEFAASLDCGALVAPLTELVINADGTVNVEWQEPLNGSVGAVVVKASGVDGLLYEGSVWNPAFPEIENYAGWNSAAVPLTYVGDPIDPQVQIVSFEIEIMPMIDGYKGWFTNRYKHASGPWLTGSVIAERTINGIVNLVDAEGRGAFAMLQDDGSFAFNLNGLSAPYYIWIDSTTNGRLAAVCKNPDEHVNLSAYSTMVAATIIGQDPNQVWFGDFWPEGEITMQSIQEAKDAVNARFDGYLVNVSGGSLDGMAALNSRLSEADARALLRAIYAVDIAYSERDGNLVIQVDDTLSGESLCSYSGGWNSAAADDATKIEAVAGASLANPIMLARQKLVEFCQNPSGDSFVAYMNYMNGTDFPAEHQKEAHLYLALARLMELYESPAVDFVLDTFGVDLDNQTVSVDLEDAFRDYAFGETYLEDLDGLLAELDIKLAAAEYDLSQAAGINTTIELAGYNAVAFDDVDVKVMLALTNGVRAGALLLRTIDLEITEWMVKEQRLDENGRPLYVQGTDQNGEPLFEAELDDYGKVKVDQYNLPQLKPVMVPAYVMVDGQPNLVDLRDINPSEDQLKELLANNPDLFSYKPESKRDDFVILVKQAINQMIVAVNGLGLDRDSHAFSVADEKELARMRYAASDSLPSIQAALNDAQASLVAVGTDGLIETLRLEVEADGYAYWRTTHEVFTETMTPAAGADLTLYDLVSGNISPRDLIDRSLDGEDLIQYVSGGRVVVESVDEVDWSNPVETYTIPEATITVDGEGDDWAAVPALYSNGSFVAKIARSEVGYFYIYLSSSEDALSSISDGYSSHSLRVNSMRHMDSASVSLNTSSHKNTYQDYDDVLHDYVDRVNISSDISWNECVNGSCTQLSDFQADILMTGSVVEGRYSNLAEITAPGVISCLDIYGHVGDWSGSGQDRWYNSYRMVKLLPEYN